MKKITGSFLILLFCLNLPIILHGQEEKDKKKRKKKSKSEIVQDSTKANADSVACEVLLPSLVGEYDGGCKKGLAHGKGKAIGIDTYEGQFRKGYPNGEGKFEYDNGDVYQGQFKEGLKHGEGIMHMTKNSQDTILDGLWVDDFYTGKKPKHPRVIYKYGIDSHSIKRQRDGDRFVIEILMNGTPNADLENFTLVSTSGTRFQRGNWIGYEGITFPVSCKVSYKTWNKLRTSRHEVIFEFEIPEPGDWVVRIIN